MKKVLSICLACVIVFTIIPIGTAVIAETLSQTQFENKLSSVKSMYPDGSKKYEWSVNGTVVGWECHGYARWLSWYVWGVDFANGKGKNWTLYKSTSTSTYVNNLVPGDVIRYRTSTSKTYNHTIFITKISGNTIYFTDCNSDGANTIKWNRSISKATLTNYLKTSLYGNEAATYGYIAHYTLNSLGTQSIVNSLTVRYNANGGTIKGSDSTIYKYTVAEDVGINLRSGAGTSYSDLATIPKGTTFTVSATKSANGYTWGQTTYDGKTGWCVISESWTTKTKIPASTYYTNDSGMVCRSISSEYHTNKLSCGTNYPNGFVNASTLGLVRDGYTFLGWSKTKTDSRIYDEDEGFKPEEIVSEVKNSNQTITMYARWEENVTLNGIEIFNLPKTTYYLGEDLDTSGMQILLKHSNNTQSVIMDGFTVRGYDNTKLGEQTLTVIYENQKAYFDIVVLKDYISGDINGDENINLNDLVTIAQYVAGWGNVEINEAALDVNGDAGVDLQDVTHLARYLAGWDIEIN